MSQMQGGRLILPKPEMRTCQLCGDTFPVQGESEARTCSAWASETIGKIPAGAPFSIFLELKLFGKMCQVARLTQTGLQELEYLDESLKK